MPRVEFDVAWSGSEGIVTREPIAPSRFDFPDLLLPVYNTTAENTP